MKNQRRALLISLEGIEGTGKSTQCRLLQEYLERQGLRSVAFREPGATAVGERVRDMILHSDVPLSSVCTTLLFAAARAQLVHECIVPALTTCDLVLLDRFCDATVAYQGYGEGVALRVIADSNRVATAGLLPDLTLLFDVAPRIGLRRSGRTDRFERRALAFHEKVRAGYLSLARRSPRRIKIIDAGADIDCVQQAARQWIARLLRRRRGVMVSAYDS